MPPDPPGNHPLQTVAHRHRNHLGELPAGRGGVITAPRQGGARQGSVCMPGAFFYRGERGGLPTHGIAMMALRHPQKETDGNA